MRQYELKSSYSAPMDVCRVIQVVESCIERRGVGKDDNPVRVVTQYWTLEGKLICEVDPCKPQ